QHRPTPHVDIGIPEERHQSCQKRDPEIAPVADGCRRNRADKQIASNSPRVPRREGEHHQSKQIEFALDTGCCAAQCEDERTEQIERDQKGTPQVLSVNESVVHDASQACAATTRAFTPVSRVGWITGAKCGLWLLGSWLSLPAFFALSYTLGSSPPKNQNTDGTCHSAPKHPKS